MLRFESLPRETDNGVYWVRADMQLVLRHQIPVQELPLLCRAVLERRSAAEPNSTERTVIYTQEDMQEHSDAREQTEQLRLRRAFARRPKAPATALAL